MKNKKIKTSLASCVLFVVLAACSILQPKDGQTQANQAQISALETQNALLLRNQDQISALETQNAILLAQNANQQSPQNIPGSLQVPAAPTDVPVSVLPTNPPVVEILPTEPVPAGQPISYEGWSMTVDPNIQVIRANLWFSIYIRNLKETSRIFRYQDRSVTLFDNIGNQYFTSPDCVQYLDTVKNLTVEASSSASVSTGGFCYMESVGRIAEFMGPVALNAKQLILRFDNFGPFNDIEVFFEL